MNNYLRKFRVFAAVSLLSSSVVSFAVTTNFYANFQAATGGSITGAAVLDGGTAVGSWSFLGLPSGATGAGAISSNSVNRAAVFAHNTNGLTGMPLQLATNYFVDSGFYPNTQPYDAGSGTRVIANLATPGQFTGAAETRIAFKWGVFGTANSAQAKGQFVRGLDASGNEVFKLLFLSGSGTANRMMYLRTTTDNSITLNANNNGTPAGTAVTFGASGNTYNSVIVNTDPSEYIQVSAVITNSQISFTFAHSQFANTPVTTFFFPINSAATTISKLEFSAMWNGNQNGGNKGFWLDDIVVSDGPLPNPKTYLWTGSVSDAWNIAGTANWIDQATGLSSTYTEGTIGGTTTVFDDSATTKIVNLATAVSPNVIQFRNSVAYTLTGNGKISGTGTTVDFNGAGTVTMSNANDYVGISSLNLGRVRLGNDAGLSSGQITFNGGWLSSVGSAPRVLPNSTAMAGNGILGDVVDNGPLTFMAQINAGSAARIVTNHSDVTFAGGAIGTGNSGRISAKYGQGKLTMKGAINFNGAFDVREGTLVLDGASLTNSDRFRPEAISADTIARIVVTNGASVTLLGTGNNLVVGTTSSNPGTNIAELAGLWNTPNVTGANGRILLQNAGSLHSEVQFLTGGDYTARSVEAAGGGINVTRFVFDGGTLRARADNPAYFQGLTEAVIRTGGARIDDSGFQISIAQDLLNGGGGGGLTKFGAGAVTLDGTGNNFTGPTSVSNGTLHVRLPSSSSAVSLGTGASLGVIVGTSPNASWNPASITLPGANALVFSYSTNSVPPTTALVTTPGLNASSGVTVAVTGIGWPLGTITLLDYPATSSPTFVFNPMPPGLSGYLTNNTSASALQLVVTASANLLTWYGFSAIDPNGYGLWDIATSMNWNLSTSQYREYGAFGDAVVFDPSIGMNPSVNLTTALKPAWVTVMNALGSDITFYGTGRITGSGSFTKQLEGNLTLNQTHDYTGGTLLQEGSITLGVNDALPLAGTLTLGSPNNTASLVLAGFNQTIQGLITGGSGTGNRRIYNGAPTPATLTLNTPAEVIYTYGHTLGNDTVIDGDNFSVVKNGTGEQRLATCNYIGTTTVNGGRLIFTGGAVGLTNIITVNSGGTLGGVGAVSGPVVLNAGASLAPGISAVNTFTISNTLTLKAGSTCQFEINKDTLATDKIVGVSDISYGGALVITNVSATPLAGGETFQLFSVAGIKAGNFSSITVLPNTGASATFDPSSGAVTISVTPSIPTIPTNITFSVASDILTLSWPSNYLGWSLQVQTNPISVGLSPNWFTIPGSEKITSINFPVIGANPSVFYRLFYQAP